MPLAVFVPAALVPASIRPDPYATLSLPGLARLAACSSVSRFADGLPEACCRLLGVQRSHDWPLAPLSARADELVPVSGEPPGGGASRRYWLFATPVQAIVGHRGVSVASARLVLPRDQADRILRDLDAFFAADALTLARGRSTGEWYACCNEPVDLETRPPGDFPGGDLNAFLPGGADAPTWRRWVSEIQMLLHDHPVNAEREAAGAPRVDALWFWGGGPENVTASAARGLRGYVDDAHWAALLRGAGATVSGSEAEGRALLARPAPPPGAEAVLIHVVALAHAWAGGVLDGWRRNLAELDREVFVPLSRRASRGEEIELVLGADRHAVALTARRAGLLASLPARWRRRPVLPSQLASWREAP